MAIFSAALRHTLLGLERSNIELRPLLDGVVDEAALGRDFWLSDADYFEIIRRALERSCNPSLGFSVGQRAGNCPALGAAGLHVSFVRSFSQAVLAVVRFHTLARDRQDVFAVRDKQQLTILFAPLDAPLPVRRFLTEAALVSMAGLLCRFAGHGAHPREVLLDYPAPHYAAEYTRVFGCQVAFDQIRAALVVPRVLAERQQLPLQPELVNQFAQLADKHFPWEHRSPDMAGRVRSLLYPSRNSRTAGMSAVARQLGVSERSLRRQLSKEGFHFRTILAEGRRKLASELFDRGMSAKQVAHQLGYRSISAFHRAFRRWSSTTPAEVVARARGHAGTPARHPAPRSTRLEAASA